MGSFEVSEFIYTLIKELKIRCHHLDYWCYWTDSSKSESNTLNTKKEKWPNRNSLTDIAEMMFRGIVYKQASHMCKCVLF